MIETVSVVVPAFNESASIGPLVSGLQRAGGWREIIVVDDGSSDDTGARAAEAGARVIRHPYNKGNGASAGRCCPSASRIRMNAPPALLIPVFTDAPLPLL